MAFYHIDNLGLDEGDTGTLKRPDLVTIRGFERDSLAIQANKTCSSILRMCTKNH